MALDGNIDNTVKAPGESSLSSLNLNSISDQPSSNKPVQIADDGVFDRNRGQGQVPQGGRAHPFNDPGSVYKTTTGKDAPAQAPVESFKDHAAEQTPKLQALGDQQQGLVNAAISGRVQGNALAVGFADNSKYAQELVKNWDLIDDQHGLIGFAGSAGRVIGVGAVGFATGVIAHPMMKRNLSAEKASTVPLYDGHRSRVVSLKDQVDTELGSVRGDPTKAREASLLQEKSDFLSRYLHGPRDGKLEALSQFNKDRDAAFSPTEKDTLKAMGETEAKLATVNQGLSAGNELKGFTGFYEHGKAGLWNGLKYVAGSLALNYAFKEAFHLVPGEHHETDRIFSQTTQESAVQAVIGASPIRNPITKAAVGGAAWLAGREEKMSWGESIVSTGLVMGGTLAAGLIPSLRSSVPKALLAEGAAFW